jgi:hypothetical protein
MCAGERRASWKKAVMYAAKRERDTTAHCMAEKCVSKILSRHGVAERREEREI